MKQMTVCSYPEAELHQDRRRECTGAGPPPAFCWPPNPVRPGPEQCPFQSPPGDERSSPSCQRAWQQDLRLDTRKYECNSSRRVLLFHGVFVLFPGLLLCALFRLPSAVSLWIPLSFLAHVC